MSFGKFLLKHSDELRDVARVLGGVISLLPIGRQDKRRFRNVITGLEHSADNIHKAADKVLDETGAIDRDELREMLREVVADILPDMLGGVAEAKARENTPAPAVEPKPKAKRSRKKKA